MKKCSLTACCFLFLLGSIQAQTGTVKGTVKDTATGTLLSDATVTILQAGDSSLVSFARTNSNGFFSIRNVTPGSYRLLITHVGYHNISRLFAINTPIPEIDFGTIKTAAASTVLQEVTVMQEKAPVIIKNDTIEYNARSFKTKPNAVVEDLLKKLPGLQVDKDGKIKSNGEEVKKILIDGKEFFGSDPKIASKNLPADAIDKVQVFDRKSDQSRFTGFDDGNSEKTINLTVKPEKKNGVFGKATAGAGDKKLYEGNFNVNSFSGERQLSAIGMANNTNKQGFSFVDLLNFTGALPGAGGRGGGMMQMDAGNTGLPIEGSGNNEGLTTTRAGGLNYNNDWQHKMDFMSSYFYNRQQTNIAENLHQQWLLPGSHFTTNKENNSGNTNENNRVNITGDYKIDSANSVRLVSSLNKQHSQYGISSQYSSVGEAGGLLNAGKAASFNDGDGLSWNSSALFRHRFFKKGRTFSATLSFNTNKTNSTGSLNSLNNYYQAGNILQQSDTINQQNQQHGNTNSYGTVLSYTEPLSKKSLLEFNYNFNTLRYTSGKTTFDADKFNGKYSVLNEFLSNKFSNDYTYHRPGMNWRYQQPKYSFAMGAAMQQASLQSNFHSMGKDSSLHRSFVNFLPNANLQYKISQYRNIRFFYNSFTRQPSVSQLQPLVDNTDPLNITMGNPDLKQEYYHRLQANYISFDPYRHTSFFAGLIAGLINNKIVNADQLGAQGQRITRPVNVNGMYNISANSSWGFTLRKLNSRLNLHSTVAQTLNAGFINGDKNKINSWNASQEITWNYVYRELLDVSAGSEITWNRVHYSLQAQQNIQYWNQHYTFDLNLYLPKGFSIATDLDYNKRSGLTQGYNLHALLWNAGIAKQVFKNKKGEFRFQVYDLLNQNNGVSRSSNQNYIEDKSYNVLKRFWQLSFTYNISRFAGKNIAAPGRRNDNIQVIRAKD